MRVGRILKKSLPQPVYSGCRRLLGLPAENGFATRGEKGADFYDLVFAEDLAWQAHYTRSPYYFCWTVMIDRLRRAGTRAVLEIGCGSGQLARALYDAQFVTTYCGFDFSGARVEHARRTCSGFRFEVADAFATDLFAQCRYDTAIATEFLEHVERDLEVISKLPVGTRFLGTVPNFSYVSHVRHFESCEEVASRYQPLLSHFSVVALLAAENGKCFFLLEGVRK